MTKKYRVVLFGVRGDEGAFQQNMAQLGVSSSEVKGYIEKAPVVLARDMHLADARKYAEAIMNAGGHVNIQETGEFPEPSPSNEKPDIPLREDFIICRNCGFKQKKAQRCVRCGFDLTSAPH
jgi:predicted transcriptional regulator